VITGRPTPEGKPGADEDLRGDVLQLMLDVPVPVTIDAQVRDGFVTLTGTAAWHYQREAAKSRTAGARRGRYRQRHRPDTGSRCACRTGHHQRPGTGAMPYWRGMCFRPRRL
jgi:hypothetical protein